MLTDRICTNISVSPCTTSATNCQQIDNNLLEMFKQKHPDVYAEECMEPSNSGSGGYCLYTDIKYHDCSTAKASELHSTIFVNHADVVFGINKIIIYAVYM